MHSAKHDYCDLTAFQYISFLFHVKNISTIPVTDISLY